MPSSNAWVESLGWMLIHSVWLIAVIAGVSAVGLGLLRQRSANARYLFGCVALLLSLSTLPAVLVWGLTRSVTPEEFGTLVRTQNLTVGSGDVVDLDGTGKTIGIDAGPELQGQPIQLEVSTLRNHDGRLLVDVDVPRPDEARATPPMELTVWQQAESRLRPHLALLVSGWLVGVCLLSVRPLIGWHSARRLQRVGLSEVSDSLKEMLSRLAGRLAVRRAVRLFQSSLVQIPCVVGAFKPVVLLPASAITGLSPEQLEALLAHELAHIRRHDFAVNVVQTLVETLLFYHPAIWWLSRRVRQEREHCCDDLAISVCDDVAGYARMLVSVEGLRGRVPQTSVAANGGSLVERIRRLLPSPHEQPRSPWLPGILVLGTLLVLVGSWQWTIGQVADLPEKTESEVGRELLPVESSTEETGKNDWPQWGRSPHRNNVADGRLPLEWDLNKGTNVVWKAKLGTSTYSSPIISGGKVFIGTNNGAALNPTHPKDKDMSCLICFEQETGKLLWQYASEKLPTGRVHDWPGIGLCSTACVDGDRVWVVTNRCEVVCLDANGFRDGENDGPFREEPSQTEVDADVIWKFDMFGKLGVSPLYQSVSSITQVDGVLLLNTSNGPDESHVKIPAPNAPNFLALDAKTGRAIWTDNSAGESIVVGGSSCSCSGASPSVATLGGITQAIFTGKEGWVYSYDFADLKRGKTTLLWQFDCNPKTAKHILGNKGRRNTLLASPVVANGLVYVTTGQNPEHGEGDADLWCIDPTKRGDLSTELVFNQSFENGEQPIPHKPLCACEPDKGDFVRPNPNAGAIWHYAAADHDGDGKIEFEETFHRTLGNPAIHDGLLFVADTSGLLHCLDSQTGATQWTHDLLASTWSSCVIADGHVLIGDEDGDVEIFKAARTKQPVHGDEPPNFGGSIYSTPIIVNGTLFIATKDSLVAIRDPKQAEPSVTSSGDGHSSSVQATEPGTLRTVPVVETNVDRSQARLIVEWSAVVDDDIVQSIRQLKPVGAKPQLTADNGLIRCSADELRSLIRRPLGERRNVVPATYARFLLPTPAGFRTMRNPWDSGDEVFGGDRDEPLGQLMVYGKRSFEDRENVAKLQLDFHNRFSGRGLGGFEVGVQFNDSLNNGEALAWTVSPKNNPEAKAAIVCAYESLVVPAREVEWMRRLARCDDWIRLGPTGMKQRIERATNWRSRATKDVRSIDPKWTRDLPNGGHVQLVALSRPAKAPLVWWTPDGKAISGIDLKSHTSLWVPDLWALVRVWEEGARRDLLLVTSPGDWKNGVQELPIDETTPGSQLVIVPAALLKREGRSTIRIGTGFGLWTAETRLDATAGASATLGKLTVKTEDIFEANVISGVNLSAPRTLNRFRWTPIDDLDVTILAVRQKGRLTPEANPLVVVNEPRKGSMEFEHAVSKTAIEHFIVKTRPRSWTEFTGFAIEPAEPLNPPLDFGSDATVGTGSPQAKGVQALEPPSKPAVKTMTGRIVDDQDRPVAGAKLWWVVSHGIPEGVIVNGVSDEQGRFSMSTPDVVPPRLSAVDETLWVLRVGKQLATVPVRSVSDVDGKVPELIVRLEPETDTAFKVVSPDQKPVVGVEVEPMHFRTHQGYDIVPAPARKIMSAIADAEGRVHMPNMPRKGFHTVRTTSVLFGVQDLRLDGNPNPPAERTIELRPTGRIEGQLKAENPAWVRGVYLSFNTIAQLRPEVRRAEGFAQVTTDDQGRFVVPAIAAGQLRINVRTEKNAPALLRLPNSAVVTEGDATNLEIALEAPVLVRGTIRTQDTDKPIPGAKISVRYGVGRQGVHVLSDAEGRYEARVLSGPVYMQVIASPKEFSSYEQVGLPSDEQVDVRADVASVDLPPIKLTPTITLKGKLIDQDGRPVAKVIFFALNGRRRYGSATTNALGEFSGQIPKTVVIESYQVWLNDGEGPPVTPTIEQREPLILRVNVPQADSQRGSE